MRRGWKWTVRDAQVPFPVQNINRTIIADAGAVELPDDMTARAFGQRRIEELNSGEAGEYFGWTLDIKDGDRLLAMIPFNSGTNQNRAA